MPMRRRSAFRDQDGIAMQAMASTLLVKNLKSHVFKQIIGPSLAAEACFETAHR